MSAHEWRDFFGGVSIFGVHLVGIERFGVEERVRDHVFFADGIFDVFLEKLQVEKIGNAQAAAAHFVFVGGADAARGGADLYAAGRILRGQFDHAVVGQDYVGAIRDEKTAVHLDASCAQRVHFFQERQRIEHNAVANHAAAAGAQHAARDQLQNEFLAVDDDGVAGVVSAGVAGNDGELLRQHVDDFPFALIAPLGADDHRGSASFHCPLR